MKKICTNVEAQKHLSCDKQMRTLVKKYGYIERDSSGTLFHALCDSILAQQISTKAYLSVKEKLASAKINLTPRDIIERDIQELRACSIPIRKIEWLKSAAKKFESKEIDTNKIKKLSDDEAIKALCSLDGVGQWTAEMLLIFSLNRPNIISFGDFGIRKALCLLYGIEKLDKKTFAQFKEKFSPYGTSASLYLWQYANEH